MNHAEIRSGFIRFFESRAHRFVPSAPVVPPGDPTLLFTNAGMNQFKDIFLGVKKTETPRVCNSQKCIRVSGKHNDLEEVGIDTYHHTFFEMLGNWSFGDYYKKEAIKWAWELLTRVWKLPDTQLYATVYKTDDEAYEIWKNDIKLSEKHILRFAEKDNFWEMGETGPCGPCSEIHIDMGEGTCNMTHDPNHLCGVNAGCSRFMEIWNLVFIQYNRRPGGSLEELINRHVDTGMGFERITSILQNKLSNYDTDIFQPIILETASLARTTPDSIKNQVPFRVIADHIRAVSFAIADGVIPSNEGRGYVIRRILRRALRYGRDIGLTKPFLHRLTAVLSKQMDEAYPEIRERQSHIEQIILSEEESFQKTLEKGLARFTQLSSVITGTGKHVISGSDAFELYDTYGFPLDLTTLLAREKNLSVDTEGFEKEMTAQKKRSRKDDSDNSFYIREALQKIPAVTEYIGDTLYEADSKLLCILIPKDDGSIFSGSTMEPGNRGILIFEKTVFYGESGGQCGDTGEITCTDGSDTLLFSVQHSGKQDGFTLHEGYLKRGVLTAGTGYRLTVNAVLREAVRRNHSAVHLLQKSLLSVLGDHVRQAGSHVSPERLRFDFNHFRGLTTEELIAVEQKVNEAITANMPVTISQIPIEEARSTGAAMFFEEKYGDVVRLVAMGSWSKELCGGSHVSSTGAIGSFRITAETSSASGIRRIEAVTAMTAWRMNSDDRIMLRQIADSVQADNPELILTVIPQLKTEIQSLRQKLHTGEAKGIQQTLESIQPEIIGSIKFISHVFSGADIKILRDKIDSIKKSHTRTVTFFCSVMPDKILFLCGVTADLIPVLHAGNLVKTAAAVCGGSGGGRADFAQAGGADPSRVAEAAEAVRNAIRNKG